MKSVPRCLAVRNHIVCVRNCALRYLMCSFHLRGRELYGEVPVQVITKVVPEELVFFSVSLEGFHVAEFPSDINS
jgi:hypothetical protein